MLHHVILDLGNSCNASLMYANSSKALPPSVHASTSVLLQSLTTPIYGPCVRRAYAVHKYTWLYSYVLMELRGEPRDVLGNSFHNFLLVQQVFEKLSVGKAAK